jgi:acetylornithine deacetylase
VTYGADMRILANVAGIPTVMFGPGDVRQAHAPTSSCPWTTCATAPARSWWPPCATAA